MTRKNVSMAKIAPVAVLVTAFFVAPPARAAATDLLPDIAVDTDLLGEIRIDTATIPGATLLRLSAGTPNIGAGRLELQGSTVVSATEQEVVQRIYRSDGTYWERSAGTSTYHPEHAHVHFDDWAIYRLRAVTADGGVGDIVAEGQKTSFCIEDTYVYDASNPSFVVPGYYTTCGFSIQGITPGWMDVYDLELEDQWIDITGVPNGQYWVEAEVDPDNRILESDETNNVSRIQVYVGPPPMPFVDRYEENDSTAEVDASPEGAVDSPNLGLVQNRLEIDQLSMEDDADYFKFRLAHAARPGAYVRIDSPYLGDIDLALFDASGSVFELSNTYGALEQVSIAGLGPGEYYIWIFPFANNPEYRLIIDPGANQPPSIVLSSPAAPEVWIEHAYATLPVAWTATDPDGDPTFVSLSIDRDEVLDKGTIRLSGYQNLDGAAGLVNVNTVPLALGRWFVYAEVTDGGGKTGQWAPGAVMIYTKGDINFDGRVDREDARVLARALAEHHFPPGWRYVFDMDRDGDVDRKDVELFRQAVQATCEGGSAAP